MGHYAYVNENLIVENVIKCSFGKIVKMFGLEKVEKIPGWLKTSYNTRNGIHWKPDDENGTYRHITPSDNQEKSLRKNFAGIGYKYIPVFDAFVEPKPYESWVLDVRDGTWIAPTQKTIQEFNDEEINVFWNEDIRTWVDDNQRIWNDQTLTWE